MPPTEIGTLTVHNDGDPGKGHPCTVWLGILGASAVITFGALYMACQFIAAALS